jgi:hypothetical protein
VKTVFINYRRGETAGEARALFNELTQTLGRDSVFMDVDTIALGRDFRQVVRERVETCDLMLALVGRDWVSSANPAGRRRLDDANDFVRIEIEAALKRNIPLTPVLVQGAQMPSPEELPETIREFAYRNGFELSHNRWESDVHEMLKRLGLANDERQSAPSPLKQPVENVPRNIQAPVSADAARSQGTQSFRRYAPWVIGFALIGAGALFYQQGRVAPDRNEQIRPVGTGTSQPADACKSGYVWRGANPRDHVCVEPPIRDEVAQQNRDAARLWVNGPYGPQTCRDGYVWREAFEGDLVCVTPEIRDRTHQENQRAAERRIDG